MELNSFMSVAEFGVVLGVVLEGTEYISPIHKRWPAVEKIGFLILVLSLIADWHFQSAINEQQTQALIAAERQISETYERAVEGAPREITDAQGEALANLWQKYAGRLDRYSGKHVNIGVVRSIEPPRIEEEMYFRGQLESVLLKAHFRVFETKIPPNVYISSGVYFDGSFDDDDMFREMAESLRSIGIEARGSGFCVRDPCEFWIYIGPRPIGAWWREEIRPKPRTEVK